MTGSGRPRSACLRIAVSGIDGAGKSTLCTDLQRRILAQGGVADVVGNLPRAYRGTNNGVVDVDDPFPSSFFFNYAAEHDGHPGDARFQFDARYVDYLMALEEVRLYKSATRRGHAAVLIHDRHLLDRRVNAYRAGCPHRDIDLILGLVPPPQLTILLDLSAEAAVERIRRRGRPGRDENPDDLRQYRELYLHCATGDATVRVIDAAKTRQAVVAAAWEHVRAVLPSVATTPEINR